MARRRPQIQDDSRERQIADHCKLRHSAYSRAQTSTPDAYDEKKRPFELKSVTTENVTTARDVGLHTVKDWRTKYWVIAKGRNLESGFVVDEMYIAHPDDLEPFFDRIESRLKKDWDRCEPVIQAAEKAGASRADLERVKYILSRGITINNPKIPMALVRKNGTRIDHAVSSRAAKQVRAFVKERPLRR